MDMANVISSGSQKMVPEPHRTFLLVQEIVDEENYTRLTHNLESFHTVCVGGTDKVRLIFSDEPPATLSEKVFQGLNERSKVTLVLLSNFGFSPACVPTTVSGNAVARN